MGPGFWGGIKAKSAENQLGKICRLGTTSTQDIRSSTSLGRNRHDLGEWFFVKQFDLPSENVGEKKTSGTMENIWKKLPKIKFLKILFPGWDDEKHSEN